MIRFSKKRIRLFLEYYHNGYSEIPGTAFVKAGFVNSLEDSGSAYLYNELMQMPVVIKSIAKYNRDLSKAQKQPLTRLEKLIHLSNLVRDSSLLYMNKEGDIIRKDPKSIVAATKELNLMVGDYAQVKKSMELTGKGGEPLDVKGNVTGTIKLDLTKLTDAELKQIDDNLEG